MLGSEHGASGIVAGTNAAGGLRRLIEAHDWSRTSCGPRSDWAPALANAVALLLQSGFPMFLIWGPDRTFLYNDAYAAILGPKHPAALGQPFLSVWPEVRDAIAPIIDAAYAGHRSFRTDMEVTLHRAGRPDRAWFTFSYGPVADEQGDIPGVLCVCIETTEAVLAREGAARERARDEQLRLATEAAEVGFWDVDPVSGTLIWPPIVKAMFGIGPDRPVSLEEDFLPCVHPDDRERVAAAYAAAIDPARRALYDVEYRTIGKEDGILRWVAAKGRGLFSDQGRCTRVIGTAVDITRRKREERAAAEQAHVLEVLNATGATLAAELDLQKLVQTVTDAGVEITGAQFGAFFYNVLNDAGESYTLYTISGVDPDRFARFPMPRNTAVFTPTFTGQGVVRSGDIMRDPRYGRNAPHAGMPHGHLPVRSYLAVPVVSRSGEVLGGLFFGHPEPDVFTDLAEKLVLGVAGQAAVAIDNARLYQSAQREIRQRRAAEEALRQLNENLEAAVKAQARERERMFALSTDLFAVSGTDGYLRAFNPAWMRLTGHDEEALRGLSMQQLIHPDDAPLAAEAMAALMAGAPMTSLETRLLRVGAEPAIVAWTAVREDGLVYSVGRDVTQDRHREEQLRQAQKMEAIGQLTGGIAHDFNNLLTGIIGSLELMQKRLHQGRAADVERFAAAATAAANRAASLTHRLLAFARRQPVAPKPVDAGRLVASIEDLLRRTIGEAISLTIAVGDGLWSMRCDPNQLEAAILNLAINARDAMPDGGRLTIRTANAKVEAGATARQHGVPIGRYVCISVSDTGTGMAPDVLSRAFDPFFTTKPIGQGTGLGLSMVYGFARQSDGHATIHSEVGHGTTVRLYLPAQGDAAEEDSRPGEPAEPRAEGGEVVLVVEDEPAVRDMVVEVLRDMGCRVLQAADGAGGLSVLEGAARIDLLVTDVGLPGLNGRQLADAARAVRPGLKVLFMTGYAEKVAVDQGFLDEGMALVTKPFTAQAIARRIRSIIGPP